MRLETISPSNHGRVSFMAQSAAESVEGAAPQGVVFYIGMFSDAVRQRGLIEQKTLARRAIINVLKTRYDYDAKIKIIEGLMLFAYLCGWYQADKTFQESLEKMQLKAAAA